MAPAPLPALRAHFRADSLLTAWALDSAAQGFRATAEAHPAFLPAALCQALVMSWSDPFNPSWQAEVLRLEGLSGLDARTAGLVEALRARSRGDMAGACAEWRALAGAQPADFVAQYGLADCVINDPLVVSDRTTRTGWRWRAELGEGRAAYRQASAQNPMVYRDLRVGVRTVGRRLFDLQADPVQICSHLCQDPLLAATSATEFRLPGAWDGFEIAIRAILGQQVTVQAATTLIGRLVERCGTPLPESAQSPAASPLTHLFPTPEQIVTADLTSLGTTTQRLATIQTLAAAVLDGREDADLRVAAGVDGAGVVVVAIGGGLAGHRVYHGLRAVGLERAGGGLREGGGHEGRGEQGGEKAGAGHG